jgi:hypothetical protein
MSKPAAKSLCLLLAAAIVAYYWRIVFTRRFSMLTDYETVSQAYSWFHFWAESIRHGSWPLWDPYMFGGRNYSGEMQTAAFYPMHLVFGLFGPDRNGLFSAPLYHAYFVLVHALAAVCMYALIRELDLSGFAAVVGGLCFSVGGFMGQVPWPHLLESAAWTPLVFLLTLRASKAANLLRAAAYAALAGLVFGLSVLAGGLHIVFMQGILLVAAGVYLAFQHKAAGNAWWKPVTLAAIAVSVAVLIGAVQLISSAEYSAHAMRFVGAAGPLPALQKIPYANFDYVPPRVIFSYLLFFNPQGTLGGVEVLDPYLGVFPLWLAIIGFWKCRRNLWVRFSGGLILVAFLYSLGRASWLHGILYALVPFLWMAREASRFLFLAHFGLVIVAAFGCEVLFSESQKIGNWRVLNSILLAFTVACGLALLAPVVLGLPSYPRWTRESLLMVLLTYPLFRWIAGGATGWVPRLLTVALIVFNLSAFSFVALSRTEVARTGTDYLRRLRSFRGVVEFLRRQPGLFRVRVLTDPGLNMGDAYGIQTLNGGGVTMGSNYFDLMNKSSAGPRLLNNRYIVRPATITDPNPVYADATWKVYEDPQALPRVWVVHEAVVEASHEGLLRRLDAPDFDPARSAMLNAALPETLEPAGSVVDQAQVESYAAEKIAVRVHAGSRGLLILSELYDPGWTARVNGAVQPIYEVDDGLRGIVVPAGDSRVTLEYAPAAVRAGGIVSIAAFAGVLAFAALALVRKND